ncbi:HACE1 [Symbiodinium natans]|uniref:HACE1 protein n=1 Tax=Symbiodinium natans TaxID=878477 RepID=A0A812IQE3_9DINO|nr:HACE1 [Symbiodinium natans]
MVRLCCTNGWTPLCYAALGGDPLLVSSLLQEKADPSDAITEQEPLCQFAAQTSALHMCAFLKRNESLRLLLDSKADMNHVDGYGANALHWAAVANNAEGIQILYAAGVGAHVPNMLGYSPFAMACSGGGTEAIQELIVYASREEVAEGLHDCFSGLDGRSLVSDWAPSCLALQREVGLASRGSSLCFPIFSQLECVAVMSRELVEIGDDRQTGRDTGR